MLKNLVRTLGATVLFLASTTSPQAGFFDSVKEAQKRAVENLIKQNLRSRLQNDPGVYKDLKTEIGWRLIHLYPLSDIEIVGLDEINGTIDVDRDSVTKIETSIEDDRQYFENETSVDRTRNYTFVNNYSEQTVINVTTSKFTSKSKTVTLSAGFSIKGVNASGSVQKLDSFSLTESNSNTKTYTASRSETISESVKIPKNTILIMSVTRTEYDEIYPFSGLMTFDGLVRIRRSFDGLIAGDHPLKYVIPNEQNRTFPIEGRIVSKLSSSSQIRWVEKKFTSQDKRELEALVASPIPLKSLVEKFEFKQGN